jgi:hypothetical protein
VISGDAEEFLPLPQFRFCFSGSTQTYSIRLIFLLAGFARGRLFQIPTAEVDAFCFYFATAFSGEHAALI